uniref:Uncharacterized protein n=1 Tax=Arundo donax TaxID=35708 RepID=A0A0A8ZU82_ARUDO
MIRIQFDSSIRAFVRTLLVSTFLMRIAAISLIRVLLLSFSIPVLMLRMVLLSVRIVTFLRLLVLF